jgi:drug/metabolite transporter (DMT)-like permease
VGGFFIGFWSTLNMVAQSFALSTISSAMTAFFVTLNILFVPFLLFGFGLSRLKIVDIVAVILGLISIFVIFHGSLSGIKKGDLFGLLAAFSIAMNIVTIYIVTKNQAVNRLLLAFVSMAFGVVFLSYFPFLSSQKLLVEPKVWGALLYQGCISTALAYLLQMTFQGKVGETRTAIILNLDLVFASLFGLLNGESLTLSQIIGGGIALFASIFHDIFPFIRKLIGGFSRNFSHTCEVNNTKLN